MLVCFNTINTVRIELIYTTLGLTTSL